jgi:cytochrome c biogenesis protein CcdA
MSISTTACARKPGPFGRPAGQAPDALVGVATGEEAPGLSTWALMGIGLALGVRHAADSDHVVAVTAIAARYKRVGPAALIGMFWGLGHTLTIWVVGGSIIALNLTVPPRVGLSLEFAVGIVLTIVGMLNLTGQGGFLSSGVGPEHEEGHSHERSQGLRAFLVGLVHGLAGSAAIALMVLATVGDPATGAVYLVVFGVGTIAGMMLVTLAFASPVALLARRFRWSGASLRIVTGMLSVAFGIYVMYEIGLVQGLFRANPHWAPR